MESGGRERDGIDEGLSVENWMGMRADDGYLLILRLQTWCPGRKAQDDSRSPCVRYFPSKSATFPMYKHNLSEPFSSFENEYKNKTNRTAITEEPS